MVRTLVFKVPMIAVAFALAFAAVGTVSTQQAEARPAGLIIP